MSGFGDHPRFETHVLTPLRRLEGTIRRHMIVEGLATCIGLAALLIVAHLMLDRMLVLGVGPRAAVLLLLIAFAFHQARLRLIRPARIRLSPVDVAALLERRNPSLRDQLVSAVAFATARAVNPRRDSPEMVAALIERCGDDLAGLKPGELVRRRRHGAHAALGAGVLLGMVAAATAAPDVVAAYVARNILLRDVPWPSRIDLVLEGFANGRLRWPIGDELILVATARDEVPAGLRAEFRSDEGGAVVRGMDRRGRDQFSLELGPVLRSMRVRLLAERWGVDQATEWYEIEAIHRPAIREATLRITPPGYSAQPPYTLPGGQTGTDVLRGARVGIEARPSKPVVKAALHLGGAPAAPAEIGPDGVIRAEFEPARTGAYYFDIQDAEGLTDTRPVTFPLRVTSDPPPRVRLALPGAGEMVAPNAVLDLDVEADDNLAIRKLEIVQRAAGEATTQPATQPAQPVAAELAEFTSGQNRYRHTSSWPLLPHGLVPGMRIALLARAEDYQEGGDAVPVAGDETGDGREAQASIHPGEGLSTTHTLRIVTREELLADLGRREHEWRREFEQIIKAQEQINRRSMDLIDLARRGMTPDAAIRFGQESRVQRQQAGRMKSVRNQFDQLLSEYRINQLASGAIRRRMDEGVIRPLTRLIGNEIIEASDLLERLRGRFDESAAEELERLHARIVQEMYGILANMLKWEGYNEAVALLQDIINMQGDVNKQTQARLEREIERLFGTDATTRPETSR